MTSSSEISLLEAARVSRGLTQSDLAAMTGISQGVISKLEKEKMPLDERADVLASALGVPSALVNGSIGRTAHLRVFHRKQASLPAKIENRLHADMLLAHVRVERLLDDVAPVPALPRLPLNSAIELPSDRARTLRTMWGLAPGPIPNIVELLEMRGVPCLRWEVDSARVDAIASWPESARPLVMLGSHAPGDRLRFTIAHEIGHAVMHGVPAPEREKEADQFASEFLMPRADIRDSLRGATLPRLAELKAYWGTSIASLARRARDLGAITDTAYRGLNIELSSSGYRKSEPVPVPVEKPTLIRTAIQNRRDAGQTLPEIAEHALISVTDLQHQYLEAA